MATKPQNTSTPTVAILPWSLAAGTEEARDTVKKTVLALFAKANYEAISEVRTKKAWESNLNQPPITEIIEKEDGLKDLPTERSLLALGKALHVDFVCTGRAKWHTKSVWVSLGPKTKADCTVDVLLIDVAKGEVVFKAEGVKADSTRSESGLESAGAVLVSMGITSISGGPKTPHQKKSGATAVAKAFEPWLRTTANRKIGDK